MQSAMLNNRQVSVSPTPTEENILLSKWFR